MSRTLIDGHLPGSCWLSLLPHSAASGRLSSLASPVCCDMLCLIIYGCLAWPGSPPAARSGFCTPVSASMCMPIGSQVHTASASPATAFSFGVSCPRFLLKLLYFAFLVQLELMSSFVKDAKPDPFFCRST